MGHMHNRTATNETPEFNVSTHWTEMKSTDRYSSRVLLDNATFVCAAGVPDVRGSDPGLRGLQWIVFVTTALAATFLAILLWQAWTMYTDVQRSATDKGSQNFQTAYPLRACVKPRGDMNLPITRCTHLKWACQQMCLRQNTTWPLWFILDSHVTGQDLLNLAVSHECAFLESYSGSVIRHQMGGSSGKTQSPIEAQSVSLSEFDQYFEHAAISSSSKYKYFVRHLKNFVASTLWDTMFHKTHRILRTTSYERRAGHRDEPLPEEVLKTFWGILSSPGRDGAHRTFTLKSGKSGNPTSIYQSQPELPPVPPIKLSGIDGTIGLERDAKLSPTDLPFFFRFDFNRPIDVSNISNPACMTAIRQKVLKTVPDQLLVRDASVSVLALPLDEIQTQQPLQADLLSSDTFCNGVQPTRFITDEYVWVAVPNAVVHPLPSPEPIPLLPKYPFNVSECSRLLLTAQHCTAAVHCPDEDATSYPDTTLRDAFVEAAKNLVFCQYLGFTMAYGDIQALYSGLFAAAITAIVIALTAVLGLVMAYVVDRCNQCVFQEVAMVRALCRGGIEYVRDHQRGRGGLPR